MFLRCSTGQPARVRPAETREELKPALPGLQLHPATPQPPPRRGKEGAGLPAAATPGPRSPGRAALPPAAAPAPPQPPGSLPHGGAGHRRCLAGRSSPRRASQARGGGGRREGGGQRRLAAERGRPRPRERPPRAGLPWPPAGSGSGGRRVPSSLRRSPAFSARGCRPAAAALSAGGSGTGAGGGRRAPRRRSG